MLKKIGIERRVYTSGRSKSFLDPFTKEKTEDIKRLKDIQEQIHENFINLVKTRRGKKLNKSKTKEIFSGLFWVGQQAVKLGLVDGIGRIDETIKNKFGEKYKIKMIEPKKSFIQRKLSSKISPSLINTEELIEYFEDKAYWSRYGL